MCIIEYADAYSYACGIAPHKHKRTAYAAMRPHFKTIGAIDCWKTIRSLKKFENKIISSPSLIYWQKYFPKICNCTVIM
jgi:hypothetical protein